MQEGCGCATKWLSKFDTQEVIDNHLAFTEIDMEERNQYRLFAILSFCQTTETHKQTAASKGHSSKERQHAHTHTSIFMGNQSARLLFLYATSKNSYAALAKHYQTSPVASHLTKAHGNKKRLPSNMLSLEIKQEAWQFILTHANKHYIPLPGLMPGVTNFTKQQLPSDVTKAGVHQEYVMACEEAGKRVVGLTIFKELWPTNIHVMKLEAVICSTCQKKSCLIFRSASQSDELKRQRVPRPVTKSTCSSLPMRLDHMELSISLKRFVTFIWNQNLKCDMLMLFCWRLIPIFSLFLSLSLPGHNHWKGCRWGYLSAARLLYTYEEKVTQVHADNCAGQNKNSVLLHYLCWRYVWLVWTPLFAYAFLLAGVDGGGSGGELRTRTVI